MAMESLQPTTKRPCLFVNDGGEDDQAILLNKTRLTSLSNDCLVLILDHLMARNLAKLVQTGEKMFCARVLFAAQRFHLVLDRNQKPFWPRLISQLYNLRYLKIDLIGFDKTPLFMDVQFLSSSLTELKLNRLTIQADYSYLSPKMFPHLQSINLMGSSFLKTLVTEGATVKNVTREATDSIALAFQNLDSLVLPDAAIVDQKFVDNISPTLSTLKIGPVIGGVDFSRLELKTLYITLRLKEKPIILPNTLVCLEIYMIDDVADSCPILPPSLTRLKLHGQTQAWQQFFFCKKNILAKLTKLHIICLPTSLPISKTLFLAICRAVPNVKSIIVSGKTNFDKDVEFSSLPLSLTQVSCVCMANPLQWKDIPKQCRVLEMPNIGGRQAIINTASLRHVSEMPDIVESIGIDMIHDVPVMNVLPERNWTGLTLIVAKLPTFTISFFESLPSTLITLRLSTPKSLSLTSTCLAHLTNLKSFSLKMEEDLDPFLPTNLVN